jgi:hypothetical protein
VSIVDKQKTFLRSIKNFYVVIKNVYENKNENKDEKGTFERVNNLV